MKLTSLQSGLLQEKLVVIVSSTKSMKNVG